MEQLPFISALIVMRNEEEYIEECLLSLINQNYPKDKYEIIVVDGESTDASVKIVEKYKAMYNNISLYSNPKRTLASGWNLAIKNAKGDIVIRPDAHSYVEKDFFIKNIETLNSVKDATCVGGKLISICKEGFVANAISKVLSSPFGVGNSQFRVGNKPGYVDTVAYGAYKKEIFDRVGYFNENLKRNQDLEMHSRIKEAGGKFYFNPAIKSFYYTRNTYKGLIKQAFTNGKWNLITLKWRKNALSLRHLVPVIFVSTLLINVILSFFISFWSYILLLEIFLYLVCALFYSFKISLDSNKRYIFLLPTLFFSLHFTYGVGSIVGFLNLLYLK